VCNRKEKQYDLFGKQEEGHGKLDHKVTSIVPTTPERKVWYMVQQEIRELKTIQGKITAKLIRHIMLPHTEGLRKVAVKLYQDDPKRWGTCIKVMVRFVAVIKKLFS